MSMSCSLDCELISGLKTSLYLMDIRRRLAHLANRLSSFSTISRCADAGVDIFETRRMSTKELCEFNLHLSVLCIELSILNSNKQEIPKVIKCVCVACTQIGIVWANKKEETIIFIVNLEVDGGGKRIEESEITRPWARQRPQNDPAPQSAVLQLSGDGSLSCQLSTEAQGAKR